MPQTTRERRKYSRIHFDANATIEQNNSRMQTHLIDISLNGVLVETPKEYELNIAEPTTIDIALSDETHISMQVTLAHSSSHFLGFHCTSLDVESISHLRRLIELNMDDGEAFERVLSELIRQN